MKKVLLGIDRLLHGESKLLHGRRLGLVVNQTSQTSELMPVIDAIRGDATLRLTALFGPEHGVRGDTQAGVKVGTGNDPATGLPAYSLYGEHIKPDAGMLTEVDTFVFDIQDAGVRFFTYIYTLAYVMQAAAEHDREVVVLDRPNPITGSRVEGNVLEPGFESFVGLYPIALRHGMTVGEIATMFNHEFSIGCRLQVLEMQGWKRSMWFDQTGCLWVPPAPNMPTLDTAIAYPGTCLFEGINVSEGRGTTRPFEVVGAPWINAGELWAALRELKLPGVVFRQACFTPTFDKYKNELCQGVQVHVTDRDAFLPVTAGLHMLCVIRELYPEKIEWRAGDSTYAIDELTGGDQVRHKLEGKVPVPQIEAAFTDKLGQFMEMRRKYLIYD